MGSAHLLGGPLYHEDGLTLRFGEQPVTGRVPRHDFNLPRLLYLPRFPAPTDGAAEQDDRQQ